MATAIENAQYADSAFSNLRSSFGRYFDAQVQIAQRAEQERRTRELMNLKRVQEIQDQQAEAGLRERLMNLQVGGQKDIEESRANRDDARWKAAQTREDTKASEAEKKAVIASVRAAYEKYKADGGPKKLAEFGPEDSPDTIYAIQNAHQEVVAEDTKRRFAQFGQNLMDRERALAASVEPDDKELSAIRQDAIAFVSGDAAQSNAAEYYAKLAAKNPDAAYTATVQRFPAFGAAVEAQVQRGASAMRAEKAKSPEFIKNLQSLSVDRQTITEAAVKNPYGDAFFAAIKPLPIATPKKPANLSNLGGKKAETETAADTKPLENLSRTYGEKGIIGVADSARGEVSPVDLLKMAVSPVQSIAGKAITTPSSWLVRNAPYVAGVPLQILGGDTLVRSSGIDQYDTLLNNLHSQNFQQFKDAVRPSYQKTADTLRNLLQSNP